MILSSTTVGRIGSKSSSSMLYHKPSVKETRRWYSVHIKWRSVHLQRCSSWPDFGFMYNTNQCNIIYCALILVPYRPVAAVLICWLLVSQSIRLSLFVFPVFSKLALRFQFVCHTSFFPDVFYTGLYDFNFVYQFVFT